MGVLLVSLGFCGGVFCMGILTASKIDRCEAEAFLRGVRSEADRRDGLILPTRRWEDLDDGTEFGHDWQRTT